MRKIELCSTTLKAISNLWYIACICMHACMHSHYSHQHRRTCGTEATHSVCILFILFLDGNNASPDRYWMDCVDVNSKKNAFPFYYNFGSIHIARREYTVFKFIYMFLGIELFNGVTFLSSSTSSIALSNVQVIILLREHQFWGVEWRKVSSGAIRLVLEWVKNFILICVKETRIMFCH